MTSHKLSRQVTLTMTCKKVQQVKLFGMLPSQAEFRPQNPHKWKRTGLTKLSSGLTSANTHKKIVNKLKTLTKSSIVKSIIMNYLLSFELFLTLQLFVIFHQLFQKLGTLVFWFSSEQDVELSSFSSAMPGWTLPCSHLDNNGLNL